LIQVRTNASKELRPPSEELDASKMTYAYAIGGYNIKEGQALTSAERYCQKTREWELCGSLTTGRINPGACQAGPNSLYAFGGRTISGEFLETIERYSI
jgi:hypothetical protein